MAVFLDFSVVGVLPNLVSVPLDQIRKIISGPFQEWGMLIQRSRWIMNIQKNLRESLLIEGVFYFKKPTAVSG